MAGTTFVDANYRFIAAYQEVNARIVQHQQSLALYVILTATLLAGLLASGEVNLCQMSEVILCLPFS